jgi:hypothetical protein
MSPPMSGPSTVDTANTLIMKPWYLPRSRGGRTSPMIVMVNVKMPPAPMPCSARHHTSIVIDVDAPHSVEPAMNVRIDSS